MPSRGLAFVTGSTGFVGGELARRLVGDGWEVVGFARGETRIEGVRATRGDLADANAVLAAMPTGGATVWHVGGAVGNWGPRGPYHAANVRGTANVLSAAARRAAQRVVHVSSPSMCFRWKSRLKVREDDPLPARSPNAYAWSKRLAEEQVQTWAEGEWNILRPRAVIGAGDAHILPRMAAALRAGRLPQIGDGTNVMDMTSIENAVDALGLAGTAPAEQAAGKVFHVTNGAPTPFWDALRDVCARLGVPPPRRRLPFALAFALGAVFEVLGGRREPPLTRYSVCLLGRSQTLSIERARRDLGYAPRISTEESLEAWCAEELARTNR